MPQGRPLPIQKPADLRDAEAAFIRDTVKRFYGEDAIIRNFGPDPKRLELHVETNISPGMKLHDCLGMLMCHINRDSIALVATKRGGRIRGSARIAYRQGFVL